MVQYLLQLGADPSVRNGDGKTPAAESDEPEVVAALIKAVQQRQASPAAGAAEGAAAPLAAAPAEAAVADADKKQPADAAG